MADNGTLSQELTYKQRRAITALLTTRTSLEAANNARISTRTLARWLTMPHFQAELHRAGLDVSTAAVGATMRRLTDGQAAALDTLEDVMTRGKANERRLAATSWLTIYADLKELFDFEGRLDRLEEDLKP